MNFGAFIITYERSDILADTLQKILDQSYPPQVILVVDNSETKFTESLVSRMDNSGITYLRVGHNSGPAGAAKIGLEELTKQGFDWIYWGDDNDPPPNKSIFKDLFLILEKQKNVGIIGAVGGMFNRTTGRTRGFRNKELTKIVEADYIAGGKSMIVNSEVVKRNILPTEKLFFGFEELDFCLKVKAAGFRVIFDGENVKNGREANGNSDPNYKWRGKSFGNHDGVWRQYYSLRNMLYILSSRNFVLGYLFCLSKSLLKILLSVRYGYFYFNRFGKAQICAIYDHFTGKYGKTNIG